MPFKAGVWTTGTTKDGTDEQHPEDVRIRSERQKAGDIERAKRQEKGRKHQSKNRSR